MAVVDQSPRLFKPASNGVPGYQAGYVLEGVQLDGAFEVRQSAVRVEALLEGQVHVQPAHLPQKLYTVWEQLGQPLRMCQTRGGELGLAVVHGGAGQGRIADVAVAVPAIPVCRSNGLCCGGQGGHQVPSGSERRVYVDGLRQVIQGGIQLTSVLTGQSRIVREHRPRLRDPIGLAQSRSDAEGLASEEREKNIDIPVVERLVRRPGRIDQRDQSPCPTRRVQFRPHGGPAASRPRSNQDESTRAHAPGNLSTLIRPQNSLSRRGHGSIQPAGLRLAQICPTIEPSGECAGNLQVLLGRNTHGEDRDSVVVQCRTFGSRCRAYE